MNKQQIYEYYSNGFVLEQLLKGSSGREVAGALWDGTYDKRPNILQFSSDIIQMVKKGVTSFHFSVERWNNPMALATENASQNYNKLRSGWDVIIDIDSKLDIEEGRIAAIMVCELLESYNIKNYGIKFSGSRGFHICIPWEMFPKTIDYTSAATMYPDVPKIIAGFIRKKIRNKLMDELIRTKGAKNLIDMMEDVPENISPYFFVEIEKDWGSRHMFRAPFSLNEKTWMVSAPLSFNQMKNFSADIAESKYVVSHSNTYERFFRGEENEAADLLTDAMDWHATIKKEPQVKKIRIVSDRKINEEYFPPCIKNILAGLSDGRKRSIFTLVNFLRLANWDWQAIEEKIYEWNQKNKPPLPRSIILGHLRYGQRNTKNYTPANCPPEGDLFYSSTVNVCRPDNICRQGTDKIMIKNPIAYPFKRVKVNRKITYRGYSCGICNKEFKNMRSLNQHKSRMHDIEV